MDYEIRIANYKGFPVFQVWALNKKGKPYAYPCLSVGKNKAGMALRFADEIQTYLDEYEETKKRFIEEYDFDEDLSDLLG